MEAHRCVERLVQQLNVGGSVVKKQGQSVNSPGVAALGVLAIDEVLP